MAIKMFIFGIYTYCFFHSLCLRKVYFYTHQRPYPNRKLKFSVYRFPLYDFFIIFA